MSTRRCLLVALLAGLAPAGARADAPDPCGPQVTDAKRLAEEGLRRYKAGFLAKDQAGAHDLFQQSLRCYEQAIENSQTPSKIYHPLGLVYEKLDRPEDALYALERFLREVPESERSAQVSQKLRDKVETLRAAIEARRGAAQQPQQALLPPPPAPQQQAPPAPPPPEVEQQRRGPIVGLVIAGAASFGVGYLLSVVSGAVCDPFDCGQNRWGLYVPIFGPFIAMGTYQNPDDRDAVRAFFVVDAIIQSAGVGMLIGGAIGRRGGKAPAKRSWLLLPGPGQAGLAIAGRF